jgi:hypothetical protein
MAAGSIFPVSAACAPAVAALATIAVKAALNK